MDYFTYSPNKQGKPETSNKLPRKSPESPTNWWETKQRKWEKKNFLKCVFYVTGLIANKVHLLILDTHKNWT